MTYSIYFEGKKALDAALAFQSGACYRVLRTHGKSIGQVEAVLSRDCGDPADAVIVSYIPVNALEKAISAISRIGFSGCLGLITKDEQEGPCYCKSSALCAIRI